MRIIFVMMIILGACSQLSPENISPEPPVEDNWTVVASGLEQDTIRNGATIFQAVRIDPTQYTFRAHYRPNAPLTLAEWQAELPNAEVIINANFFTPENTVLGLLIADSVRYGTSYTNRGATFFVDGTSVGIRSNITQPYQVEAYTQAIQAFPMLVGDGLATYNNSADTAISRRTVIAQDEQGHIILMVTSGFGLSLYDLSQYLPTTDLNIVDALNLDGGGSTMMSIASSETTVLSLDPVPVVLAIYPN
ncbi:MAG: phosphodiester glycosidase family protein [Phototrophicaceae bacterium]